MYAVIRAGGKQQKVKAGDVIEIELMHRGQDDEVTFQPILVVDDDGKTHYGKELNRAVVKGKLVGEQKGEKIRVFKYRPKSGYARQQGHRQMYTLVEIADVSLGRRTASRKAREEEGGPPSGPAPEAGPPEEEPTPEDVGAVERTEPSA
jgi:large subunit ribosomal protein L21